MILTQSAYALGPKLKASFLASGGVAPISYAVGLDPATSAGGTIDSVTGVYRAPAVWNPAIEKRYDTIVATDGNGATVSGRIMVGHPLNLFLEIIQREMGLADDQLHLYQQKFMQPNGPQLQIAVGILDSQVFANNNRSSSTIGGMDEEQYVTTLDTLSVNIMSADLSALYRRFDPLLALGSNYSQYQQTANAFKIGRIPRGRVQNLSDLEPTRIPYRFQFPVTIQYVVQKNAPIGFYDQFQDFEVYTN